MMYSSVLVLCAATAVAVLGAPQGTAAPKQPEAPATIIPIISQSEELEPNGTYKFSFETGNGIKREEIAYDKTLPAAQGRSAGDGKDKDAGDSEDDEIHVQEGSYSYTAPDGTHIHVRYTADENGFRPVGDHLPTSPPIPADIQKSLSAQPSDSEQGASARSAKAISSPTASAPASAASSGPEVVSAPEAPAVPEATAASEASTTETAAAVTEVAASATDAAVSSAAPADLPTETAASSEAQAIPTVAATAEALAPEAPSTPEVSAESPTASAPTTVA